MEKKKLIIIEINPVKIIPIITFSILLNLVEIFLKKKLQKITPLKNITDKKKK